jgi:hypothetical protein
MLEENEEKLSKLQSSSDGRPPMGGGDGLRHGIDASFPQQDSCFRYGVYGITLRSQIALSLSEAENSNLPEVELKIGSPSLFLNADQWAALKPNPGGWGEHAFLRDGSIYLRWPELADFLVSSDGFQITFGLGPAPHEAFQVYLLGQALSFALVKTGFEPLHSTSVVIDGSAVAFLGNSGFGKSSLAASFVGAGYPLLTDDLLLFRHNGEGLYGYPGPPRIKLFPKVAREFLKSNLEGVPMNNNTRKLVMPLFENQVHRTAARLKAIYVLNSPRNVFRKQRTKMAQLHPREAFVSLLRNTFNRLLIDPERLKRQFAILAQLVAKVPVFVVSYPRVLSSLPEVRELILRENTKV